MSAERDLSRQATGLLIGYGVQFFAGMSLNLFVDIPRNHPGAKNGNYYTRSGHSLVWALSGHGSIMLAIHALIGLLLVLGSIALMLGSIKAKNKLWIWCGTIAALCTLGAFSHGLSFLDYNNDVSSMVMAANWLAAVGALVFGVIYDLRHGTPRIQNLPE